jgi:hypothetical protein
VGRSGESYTRTSLPISIMYKLDGVRIQARPVEGRVDVEADLATENKMNMVEAKGYTVSHEIRSTN